MRVVVLLDAFINDCQTVNEMPVVGRVGETINESIYVTGNNCLE